VYVHEILSYRAKKRRKKTAWIEEPEDKETDYDRKKVETSFTGQGVEAHISSWH
jgi:hypothetical protein